MGAAAPFIAPALGFVGSLIGNNQASHSAQQATNAAQQDATAQTGLDQQALNMYQQLAQQYQQQYSPLVGPLSQSYGPLAHNAGNAANTGFSQYENFLQNPQYTLGGLGGIGGDSLAFYLQQAAQGIDPKTIAAAQQGVANTGQQQINSMENAFGSGFANPTGAAGDIAGQALEASAGLGANIAGQQQSFQNQAQGQAQTLAGGIDANTMNMLMQAYNTPMGALGGISDFISQGRQYLPGAAQGITGIAGQYGAAGTQAGQNAYNASQSMTNPFTGLANFAASRWPAGGGNSPPTTPSTTFGFGTSGGYWPGTP